MKESEHYAAVRTYLEDSLREKFPGLHLEITATRRFSNKLKSHVGQHRDIVFHFLRKAAPDITGFIPGRYSADFVVIEIKGKVLKLDDIYQTRKYAELLDARYAVLVSTAEIPEELKRLSKAVHSLLLLPASRTMALARFDSESDALCEWFPRNPFD